MQVPAWNRAGSLSLGWRAEVGKLNDGGLSALYITSSFGIIPIAVMQSAAFMRS